jgi:hypothetical protein
LRIKTLPQIVNFIKAEDPHTAINESMLVSLINEKSIPVSKRGNRTVADIDTVIPCLNQLLTLENTQKIPHIRTIRGAVSETKEKIPDLGIGEKQIREAVDNEKISAIRVGNRAYIAMEFFEEPFVTHIFSSDFDRVPLKKPNRAVEQFNELLAQNVKMKKMIRLRT